MQLQIEYITTHEQLVAAYYMLMNADRIGLDTEGTSLDPYTNTLLFVQMCMKVSEDSYVSCVFDLTKIDHDVFSKQFSPLLEYEGIVKIGHNLIYDWKMIYHATKIEMEGLHDTMITERMLWARGTRKPEGFGLQAVVKERLHIDIDKEVRDTFIHQQDTAFSQEQIEYAAYDAFYVLLLYDIQMKLVEAKNLEKIYHLEMSVIPPTAMQEYTGLPVNKSKLESMIEPFTRFTKSADKALQELFIQSGEADTILFDESGYSCVNTSSPKQMLAMLNKLGINVPSLGAKIVQRWEMLNRKKKAKDWQIDYHTVIEDDEVADALEEYHLFENPYLRAYAFLKGALMLLNTFIFGMLNAVNPVTKRIHPHFNSYGAMATGRESSNKVNAHNMPNDKKLSALGLGEHSIRETIECQDENEVLLISDYAGIELVILAVLSGDKKLMYEILEGDIHTIVTQKVLKYGIITPENKKKSPHKLWRDAAKTLSYSIAYGTTGRNLSETLNIMLASEGFKITPKEGDQLILDWYALFPDTAKYLKGNATQAIQKGYVCDAWGRRRNWDKSTFVDKWKMLAAGREGMNSGIQGTGATMMKRAKRLFWDQADRSQARIILSVHDELVAQSTIGYQDDAARILKSSMEQALAEVLPSIADKVGKYESLSVDPKISRRYDK